jgi:membrane protein CcdC involved in cytochrome C biogenesis
MIIKHKILLLQIILFSLGAAMIVLGLFRQEASEVLKKAVIVCMECIGIG